MNRRRVILYTLLFLAVLCLIPLLWGAHKLSLDKVKFTEEWYKTVVSTAQLCAGGLILDRIVELYRQRGNEERVLRQVEQALYYLPSAVRRTRAHLAGEKSLLPEEKREVEALLLRSSQSLAGLESADIWEILRDKGFPEPHDLLAVADDLKRAAAAVGKENSYDSNDSDALGCLSRAQDVLDGKLPTLYSS